MKYRNLAVRSLVFLTIAAAAISAISLLASPQQREPAREATVAEIPERPFNDRADLTLSDLQIKPADPVAGRPAAIEVLVANRGEAPASNGVVTVRADGAAVASIPVRTLALGQSLRVQANWTPRAAEFVLLAVDVKARGLAEKDLHNNSLSREIAVVDPGSRKSPIVIVNSLLDPPKPKPGESALLQVTVKNRSDRKVERFPVRVRLGKNEVRILRLDELGPGKTKRLSHRYVPEKGDGDVEVDTETTTATRSSRPPARGTHETPPSADENITYVVHAKPEPDSLPDLQVKGLSVQKLRGYSTSDGHVFVASVAFRVTNTSTKDAPAFSTRVTVESTQRGELPTPKSFSTSGLAGGEAAYFQWTFPSGASSLKIEARTDANERVSEVEERNNAGYADVVLGSDALDQWKSLGPDRIMGGIASSYPEYEAVGKLESYSFDCADHKTIYVTAARCGVWRSRNDGASWEPLTDALPTVGFFGVQADPFQAGVVYALAYSDGGSSGVFRSADYGDSWIAVNDDFLTESGYSNLIADPRRRDRYWATSDTGLYQSTDGCRTWTRVFGSASAPTQTTGTPLQVTFDVNGLIYMMVTPRNGSTQATLAKSSDGGATWKFITQGLFSGGYSARVAASPSRPRTLYLGVKDTSTTPYSVHLHKSTDAGETWQETIVYQSRLWWGARENIDAIAVHPTDPDIVFIGGVDLYLSKDGGQTVDPVGPVHCDQHEIFFHPDDPAVVYVLNDGGIYRSRDRGLTWRPINRYISNVEFYEVAVSAQNRDLIVGGTQDNGDIEYSASGDWRETSSGDGTTLVMNPSADAELYAAFQFPQSLGRATRQGGSSGQGAWSYQGAHAGLPDEGGLGNPSVAFNPNNPAEAAICAGDLYVTMDRGASWTKAGKQGIAAPVLQCYYGPAGRLFAVSEDGRVYVWGEANRQNCREITLGYGISSSPTDLHVRADGSVIVCFYRGRTGSVGRVVLLEHHSGDDFAVEDITSDLPIGVVPTAVLASPFASAVVYLGTANGIYKGKKNDEGEWEWREYSFGLPLAFVCNLVVNENSGDLIAGTTGRGAFRTKIWESKSGVRPK